MLRVRNCPDKLDFSNIAWRRRERIRKKVERYVLTLRMLTFGLGSLWGDKAVCATSDYMLRGRAPMTESNPRQKYSFQIENYFSLSNRRVLPDMLVFCLEGIVCVGKNLIDWASSAVWIQSNLPLTVILIRVAPRFCQTDLKVNLEVPVQSMCQKNLKDAFNILGLRCSVCLYFWQIIERGGVFMLCEDYECAAASSVTGFLISVPHLQTK